MKEQPLKRKALRIEEIANEVGKELYFFADGFERYGNVRIVERVDRDQRIVHVNDARTYHYYGNVWFALRLNDAAPYICCSVGREDACTIEDAETENTTV